MDIKPLSKALNDLNEKAKVFFIAAATYTDEVESNDRFSLSISNSDKYVDIVWSKLPADQQKKSLLLQKDVLSIVSELIPAIKASPLLNQADERDIGICAKTMRAALRLRQYQAWDTEILHDEKLY